MIQETYGRLAAIQDITLEQVVTQQSATTPLRRLPTLAEVANVAAFMASDQASLVGWLSFSPTSRRTKHL